MKHKSKKIIIVSIIMLFSIVAIIGSYTWVKAASTVAISYAQLSSSNTLYCREGGAALQDTFNSGKVSLLYDIPCNDPNWVELKDENGNGTGQYHQVGYVHSNDNHEAVGKSISNLYTAESRTIKLGSDTTNKTKVGHNFYLGGGYSSQAQRWAWQHSSIVTKVMGFSWSETEGRTATSSYNSKINTFAEQNKAKITKGSKMSTESPLITENYKVGPFSVKYNQKIEGTEAGSAWIDTVEVTDIDGKIIDSKYISLIDEKGNEIKTKKITPEDNKARTVIDLGSNVKFYVINKSEQEVKSVKVKTIKLAVEYTFKCTIYTGTKAQVAVPGRGNYSLNYKPQNIFNPGKVTINYVETSDEITFNVKAKKGNLEIEKIGVYNEDGAEKTENLAGIKFKVYCGEPINKWVKSVNSKKIEWTDKAEEAKVYTTGEDGKVAIKNLYATKDVGKSKYIYEYKIVECEQDKNVQPYYLDPIFIEKSTSDLEKDESVDTSMSTGDRAKYAIKGVTAFYGKTNNIKITDRRTSKDIIIEKDDVEHNDLKLEGVEFKIKLKSAKYYNSDTPYEKKENLWLKNPMGDETNGIYDFKELLSKDYLTSNEAEAGIFKTNAEGKINILCVIDGEYETYETKSIDMYDLELQPSFNDTAKYRICETIKDNNNTSRVTIHNEKTRGPLSVIKLGENKAILDKVQFAVFCEETKYGARRDSSEKYSGWLTGKLDYTKVSWDDIGEIFKGDPKNEENRYKTTDGIFSIQGLPVGKYTIYEIVNNEDYYDLEGQEKYIKESNMVKLGEYNVVATKDNKPLEVKELGNTSTRGNFELTKLLENKEKGASDIELEIYVEDTVTGAKYWLGPVGETIGNYDYRGIDYNSIPKEGGKFKVDESGKLKLTCIPIGKYYIYETRTHNIEYALEGQGEFDEANVRTLIKTVDLTKRPDEKEYTEEKIVQKERDQGDLEIYKTGHYANDGTEVIEPLKDVSFIVSSTAVDKGGLKTAEQKWVFVNKNESGEDIIDFTDNKEKATWFTTGEDGKIVIKNLYVDLGPYSLEEVENKNPYYNDRIVIKDPKKLLDIDISKGTTTNQEISNEKSSGDLDIIKVDSEYSGENGTQKLSLQGAEFKIKIIKGEYIDIPTSGMWLKDVAGYDYSKANHEEYLVSDIGSAGTFVSGSDGEIHIKRIINGTYEIWETKAPEGYSLEKQKGYNKDLGMALVDTKTIQTENNNKVKVTIKNHKTVVQLDGNVWEDVPRTKLNEYNEIKDNEEKLLSGITVELYDKQKQKVIARATTDDNGYYQFTHKNVEGYEAVNSSNTYSSPETDPRLNYWELANCYVRFIYDNIGKHDENGFIIEDNYGYVTVDPFVGNNEAVNSKAKEYTINQTKLEEENLTGTTGDNPGIAITKPGPNNTDSYVNFANYEEIKAYESVKSEDKLLPGFYNNKDFTIHNINLGLKAKLQPDFTVTEEIAYMKVRFGQYTYKYEYMSEKEQIVETVPTVNEQVSSRTFTGAIYPSDVAYNKANNTDELKVYVIYRIAVQNNTTNGTLSKEQEEQKYTSNNTANNYVEEKMYLSSLTNKYDSARYVLSTDISNIDIDEVKRDSTLWSNDGDNTVRFDVNNTNNPYYNGIAPLETKTSYLQYRLTEPSVQKILEKKLTVEDLVQAPSVTTATTFHEFFRNDNLWIQSADKQYKDHKQSSYEAKGEYLHKSWRQTRKTSELWMRFDLPKEERQITGTVFEDEVSDSTLELGNGKKEDTESTVSKVLVELLSDKSNNQAVTLYQYAESEADNYKKVPAVATVNENEAYTFKGIIPGYYYLRFTYGNGEVKYKDLEGKEITQTIKSKIDNGNKDVGTNDYKSTIITSNDIREALESSDDSKVEWYKKMDADNYSTAIDDRAQREANSSQTYAENNIPNPVTVVDAYTAKMSITIENSNENVANINEVQYVDADGKVHKTGKYYNYKGFNFGIVTMPKTKLELDKKIVNVSYTMQSGEQLVSANPENSNSIYLTALDKVTGGSRYAKVEVDPTLIYGSKIDITYEVEVKNSSTPFYTNPTYSEYAEKDESQPAKVVVTVQDLLDEKYDYDTVKLVSNDVYMAGSKTPSKPKETIEIKTVQNPDGTSTTTKYKEITGWDALATGETETIRYTASALLQTGVEDPSFLNDATIDTIKLDKYISLETASTNPWDPALIGNIQEKTTFVVTPSTGEDRSNTYWIAGAIALIVLGAGIVVIKKRITK